MVVPSYGQTDDDSDDGRRRRRTAKAVFMGFEASPRKKNPKRGKRRVRAPFRWWLHPEPTTNNGDDGDGGVSGGRRPDLEFDFREKKGTSNFLKRCPSSIRIYINGPPNFDQF
ncbi:hypothetical protein V6N13_071519 [Hibiscus sabdariffa]